jgi:predicted acetyltransferase
MELRVLAGAEQEQTYYVWSQAFERGDREMRQWKEWGEKIKEQTFTVGVFDAAGLQATVLVMNTRVHLGPEVIVAMGAVGGVACLPATRGKGYAGAALKGALEQMRAQGIWTSMLFPFSWEYYRRFGWEWIGTQRRCVLPTNILRSDPETEHVRAATPADRAAILACYTQFAGQYRGMLARDEVAWNDILDHSKKEYTYTYLYERDGDLEGYLTFRGGKEEETWIREFISRTPRAQRALLGLLRRHEMQVNKFRWNAPDDDPLWSQFYHWDIEVKIMPATMGRVVDVPGALQAWKPARSAQGTVHLAVQDECAPWNSRTWRVEFEDGKVEVRPTDAPPHVRMDIQALSQAYFGTPTVEALRAADRLTVEDETGYTALRALFAGPMMWINDDF